MRVAFVLAASFVGACATQHDQLVRSQRAFEQTQYETTLALLRDLERDMTRLSQPEQAEYAYLRGMSDYRIGYRADARHWLAVAKTLDDNSPGVLPTEWKARLGEALEEMNRIVYDDGLAALSNAPKNEK